MALNCVSIGLWLERWKKGTWVPNDLHMEIGTRWGDKQVLNYAGPDGLDVFGKCVVYSIHPIGVSVLDLRHDMKYPLVN